MLKSIKADLKDKVLANVFDWMGDDAKPILMKLTKNMTLAKSLLKDVVDRSGIK